MVHTEKRDGHGGEELRRCRETNADLLAALKVVVACLAQPVGAGFRDLHPATWVKIQAAIAKATGGQS